MDAPSDSARRTGLGAVLRRVGRGAHRVARAAGLRPQRRPLWVRIGGVLLSLLVTFVVFVVLALESTTSATGGWLPATAALLPGFLIGALALGLSRWYVAVGYAVGVALAVAGWMYQTSPPEPERLRAVAVQVGAPQEWHRVSREAGGNTWCLWSDCPHLYDVYSTPEPAAVARREFVALLEADGWQRYDAEVTWRDDPENYQQWHKGRWHVTLNVAPVGSPGREYDSTVPQDLTKVSVDFR